MLQGTPSRNFDLEGAPQNVITSKYLQFDSKSSFEIVDPRCRILRCISNNIQENVTTANPGKHIKGQQSRPSTAYLFSVQRTIQTQTQRIWKLILWM